SQTCSLHVVDSFVTGPLGPGGVQPLAGTLVVDEEETKTEHRVGNTVKGNYTLDDFRRAQSSTGTQTQDNGPRHTTTTYADVESVNGHETGNEQRGPFDRQEDGGSGSGRTEVVTTDLVPGYRLTTTTGDSTTFAETIQGNHTYGDYSGTKHTESDSTREVNETNQGRTTDSTETDTGTEDVRYLASNQITGVFQEEVTL